MTPKLTPLRKRSPHTFTPGDIVSLDSVPCMVSSVEMNSTLNEQLDSEINIILGLKIENGDPNALKLVVDGRHPGLKDIRLTREIMEAIGFKDVSTHTLHGASTFQYTSPKDDNHRFIVKLDDYVKGDVLRRPYLRELHQLPCPYAETTPARDGGRRPRHRNTVIHFQRLTHSSLPFQGIPAATLKNVSPKGKGKQKIHNGIHQ